MMPGPGSLQHVPTHRPSLQQHWQHASHGSQSLASIQGNTSMEFAQMYSIGYQQNPVIHRPFHPRRQKSPQNTAQWPRMPVRHMYPSELGTLHHQTQLGDYPPSLRQPLPQQNPRLHSMYPPGQHGQQRRDLQRSPGLQKQPAQQTTRQTNEQQRLQAQQGGWHGNPASMHGQHSWQNVPSHGQAQSLQVQQLGHQGHQLVQEHHQQQEERQYQSMQQQLWQHQQVSHTPQPNYMAKQQTNKPLTEQHQQFLHEAVLGKTPGNFMEEDTLTNPVTCADDREFCELQEQYTLETLKQGAYHTLCLCCVYVVCLTYQINLATSGMS